MTSDYLVDVQHVSKKFGKKRVLEDIDLHLKKGEILGLLGPSGAGKTTLVKMIAGIDIPSQGSIQVLGENMPNLEVMKHIGFMAQADALYMELTALENLQFFASIYGLKGQKRKERIQQTMGLVNLAEYIKVPVHQYSGGMRRRLSLAIALLHEPEVLVLDEPTVGIDPVLRKSIWTELEHLRKEGTAIIVTTHVMDEADKCQRLGMIRDGKLIAVGSPSELKRQTGSSSIEEAFLVFGGEQK
ncbi:ABC transporter ATP-binding protein [Bacillus songklensis]|uniref:ABC transporter ATP-binding protein n=1 Tax=Bacillus songklensis TaxID=1069116 RepID=A0ABV8B2G6_9BACI